jgi:hypothetical protein
MILFYNAPNVLSIVGVEGDLVVLARIAIVVMTVGIAAYAWRSSRGKRATESQHDDTLPEGTSVPVSGTPAPPPSPRLAATIPVEVSGERSLPDTRSRMSATPVSAPVPVPSDD